MGLRSLFLSPHFDDEVLFGSFSILGAEEIEVVICYMPEKDSEKTERIRETNMGMQTLRPGIYWQVLNSVSPHIEKLGKISRLMDDLDMINSERWYERVFAPMDEVGGNPDHNQLSLAADGVFGDRVVHYATYTWPEGKTRTYNEVSWEPKWLEYKHRALSCYGSQIKRDSTASHFCEDLREYYE